MASNTESDNIIQQEVVCKREEGPCSSKGISCSRCCYGVNTGGIVEIKVGGMSDNEPIKHHERICKELNALYAKKNHDYGNSFHKSYEEWGLTMAAIRLGDKYNRFCKLIKTNAEVKDESIRDTLIDLANYAIMTVMEIDGNDRR